MLAQTFERNVMLPVSPDEAFAWHERPGAVQSELRIGHVAVARRAPDYHALLVLNMVLGGQFVSRLNRSLREEEGYTYGVRTAFDFRRLPGPFSLQGSVQADATGESIAEVLEQMEAISGKRAVTTPELDLARAALTRGFARGFETAGQVVRSVARIVQHALPKMPTTNSFRESRGLARVRSRRQRVLICMPTARWR